MPVILMFLIKNVLSYNNSTINFNFLLFFVVLPKSTKSTYAHGRANVDLKN